jgi:proteasome lid subunit RPN8/RPN11
MVNSNSNHVVRCSKSLKELIEQACETTFPEEACGILIGEREGPSSFLLKEIAKSRNISKDRRADRYMLDPASQAEAELKAQSKGLDVIGFYHSHPDAPAVPSYFDLAQAWPEYVYIICEVRAGAARALRAYMLNESQSGFVPLDLK